MKRLYQKSVCGLTILAGTFSGTLCYSILCADFLRPDVASDLDKEAEKEKAEKQAKPAMDGQTHEDFHRRLAMEGQENLKEINRLLDEIQKNLGQKETGAATQEKQRRTVERMESLIKELGKG